MKPIEIGTCTGHNGNRIYPASGIASDARRDGVRIRPYGQVDSMPPDDFFNDGDSIVFEDGLSLVYDEVKGFVEHHEWAHERSSKESNAAFFAAFNKASAA